MSEGACVMPEGAVSPGIVYPESEETRGRTPGASCQALRQAVAGLSRLDDFTMESIGRGFFSEVYRVVHKTTDQVMVLKMNLRPSNRPNMLKEVQLMNKLSHPNILKLEGVCVHEGQLHALTEYINGGSLEQLIQSEEPISWETRASLGLDIAQGMQYLHRRQVFHRDLTSKNVLIRRSDSGALSAVVGDFGLAAKIPHPLLPSRLSTVGSFWWMAPECITNRPYNQRADVFSFGVILLELIGRVSADPDVLLRTPSFGIDYLAFTAHCPADCNLEMLLLAFSCSVHAASSRPPFSELVGRLQSLLSSLRADVLRPVSPTPRAALSHTDDYKHHRRSLSDDIKLVLTDTCSPSDKARVHRRHSHCRESRPRTALRSPRDVAEFMADRDPAYQPGDTANPFNALKHYRDGRKVLEYQPELFSSCFEVRSPRGGVPVAPEEATPPRATCLSLPTSPVCRRRAPPPPPPSSEPPDAPPDSLANAQSPLLRLGSCESGFFSSVGEAERASASDLSPASLRSDYSQESLSRGGLTAGLAKRSSSVYTDSSDDVSSLGCETEAHDRRHPERYEKDIRQIVEYFERSGARGGGARAQRHSFGCRQRALDRLSLEWARQRLERAERAQVPPRLVADCLRVFSRRPETASRPSVKPKVPISEGTVRDKLTVFEGRG